MITEVHVSGSDKRAHAPSRETLPLSSAVKIHHIHTYFIVFPHSRGLFEDNIIIIVSNTSLVAS